jgi:hypothetical protein
VRVAPDLEELLTLLSKNALSLTLVGTSRELRDGEAWFETRIVVQDGLLRTEEPPGAIDVIVGLEHIWVGRTSPDSSLRVRPPGPFPPDLGLPRLLNHLPEDPSYWRKWLSRDPGAVVASLHPTQAHGRSAWCFTCPRVKKEAAIVTVDAETGLLLCMKGTESGVVAEWLDLDMTSRIDSSLFSPP